MIESKYFPLREQNCKCGCGKTLDNQVLMDMLTRARIMANIPFVITSWYRCEKHKESIKNPTSSHIKGKAVDIQFKNSVEAFKIIDALTRAGFRRIGYNSKKKFLHCDIDLDKASPVFFSY